MSRNRTVVSVLLLFATWLAVHAGATSLIDHFLLERNARMAGISSTLAGMFKSELVSIDLPEHSRVLMPVQISHPKATSGDQLFPVIVFLHGAGERGEDGFQQLRSLPHTLTLPSTVSRFPCYIIAPQCLSNEAWSTGVVNRVYGDKRDYLDLVVALVDTLSKRLRIDLDRVYVIGYSLGAFGAWELAARYPEFCAAVVPICGGGDPATAPRLVGQAIWAIHCADDKIVPVERTREMIDAIRGAGGTPRYTEPSVGGHRSRISTPNSPDAVLMWLFHQSRSSEK